MACLPNDLLSKDHYLHNQKFLITNSSGKPLFCYICTLSSLRNKDELYVKKLFFLDVIQSTLSDRENHLSELFGESERVANNFIHTLIGLIEEGSPSIVTTAEKCLLLLVQRNENVSRGYRNGTLDLFLAETLHQMVLQTENLTCLAFLQILVKVLSQFPRTVDYLIKISSTTNGEFGRKMVALSRDPTESFQQNAITIICKMMSHPNIDNSVVFQGLQADITLSILSIFHISTNSELILNALAIFKISITEGHNEFWFTDNRLPSALNSLLHRKSPVIQANVANCVSHLLKMASQQRLSIHSFIDDDFVSVLFEALRTPNDLLISSIVCCATLLVSCEQVYNKHHSLFCLIPVVEAVTYSMLSKNWESCCNAIKLLIKLMENISESPWESGYVSNYDRVLKLIRDGLRCEHVPTVTCVAYLFGKILRPHHLPTPVPLTKLSEPFSECLEWLLKGLKKFARDNPTRSFARSSHDLENVNKLHSHEIEKTKIFLGVLENVFGLVEICNKDPVNAEFSYTEPLPESVETTEMEQQVSASHFFQISLRTFEDFGISAFLEAIARGSEMTLILPFLRCLKAALNIDEDSSDMNDICYKLLKLSFLEFTWEVRDDLSVWNSLNQNAVLEVSGDCLGSLFKRLIKSQFETSPDIRFCLEMVDVGANRLKNTFTESCSCLNSTCESDDEETKTTLLSTQFLCLLHYYFALKYDQREDLPTSTLSRVVSNYVLANSTLFEHLPITFARVVIYLVSAGSVRSFSESDTMNDSDIAEANELLLSTIPKERIATLLEINPVTLIWGFTNPEITRALGEHIILSTVKKIPECLTDLSAPLCQLLSSNEDSQTIFWDIFVGEDEILMQNAANFLSKISQDDEKKTCVCNIFQSFFKVFTRIFIRPCNDFAKSQFISIIVDIRQKHDFLDTVDREIEIIYHVCNYATRKNGLSQSCLAECFSYLTSAVNVTSKIYDSKRGVAFLLTIENIFKLIQETLDKEDLLVPALTLLTRVDTLARHYKIPINDFTPVKIQWTHCDNWLDPERHWCLIKVTLNLFNNYFQAKMSGCIYIIVPNDPFEHYDQLPMNILRTYTNLLNLITLKHILYDSDALELFQNLLEFTKSDKKLRQYCIGNPWLKVLKNIRSEEDSLQVE